jgi:hypothetical protein
LGICGGNWIFFYRNARILTNFKRNLENQKNRR